MAHYLKGLELAEAIAAKSGGAVTRAADSQFYSAPCYVAHKTPESAIVVYDDDPTSQVMTGNHLGRFISPYEAFQIQMKVKHGKPSKTHLVNRQTGKAVCGADFTDWGRLAGSSAYGPEAYIECNKCREKGPSLSFTGTRGKPFHKES